VRRVERQIGRDTGERGTRADPELADRGVGVELGGFAVGALADDEAEPGDRAAVGRALEADDDAAAARDGGDFSSQLENFNNNENGFIPGRIKKTAGNSVKVLIKIAIIPVPSIKPSSRNKSRCEILMM